MSTHSLGETFNELVFPSDYIVVVLDCDVTTTDCTTKH